MNDEQAGQTQGDQGTNPPTPPTDQGQAVSGGQQQAQAGKQDGKQAGASKKDLSGIMEDNVDVSNLVANAGQNQQASQQLTEVKIPAHSNTKFDEKLFLELLAGSISLTLIEKQRIIEAIPQLSQFQIDELMKIFKEEKGKFAELEKKHSDQIAELESQHSGSMEDVEAKQEEEAKKSIEEQEAEDIKKQLGL